MNIDTSARLGVMMNDKLLRTLAVFLGCMFSALVSSIILGAFFAAPFQIASHLSVAFYVPQMYVGQTFAKGWKMKIALALVGALGGVTGWFLYRGIIL